VENVLDITTLNPEYKVTLQDNTHTNKLTTLATRTPPKSDVNSGSSYKNPRCYSYIVKPDKSLGSDRGLN